MYSTLVTSFDPFLWTHDRRDGNVLFGHGLYRQLEVSSVFVPSSSVFVS